VWEVRADEALADGSKAVFLVPAMKTESGRMCSRKTLARALRALSHTHFRSLSLARSLARARTSARALTRALARALSHLEGEGEGEGERVESERMEKAPSLDRSSGDAC
jgi:hypothetical protein